MSAETKVRTLNIRLLRKGKTVGDAFTDSFAPGSARALQERPWGDVEGAALYIGQVYNNPPGWVDFLAGGSADLPADMFTSGAGAVIFIPVEGRLVAICFGHVHLTLNDDAFERQFGLKVTLNTVPRGQLRTLDVATPDAVTFQKRVQASKDSDLYEFGVDMLRDLARVAGGTPRDERFAKFVAGKDSLSITCEVNAKGIKAKRQEVLHAYGLQDYRTDFSWVDNLKQVQERDTIKDLDENLERALQTLRQGGASDLHMAPPEIVDYTEGSKLHYNGFGSHGRDFFSLSVDDYVGELNSSGFSGGIDEIKAKHRINAKSEKDGEFDQKWRAYGCFVFETSLGAGTKKDFFVLFGGAWYRVEKKFKDRVEAFYAQIPKVSIIGKTTCKNEEELITDLQNSRADLLKLDRTKINPNGVRYANLEPCDFLSNTKQFIHLKDGSSSGPISHLWSQGVVSAEAFVSDPEFRKKLRAKVRSLGGGFETQLPKSGERVVRDQYTIIYGIMRKPYADGTLGLPFFSKVSLQAALERIAQFGIPVALELIEKPA